MSDIGRNDPCWCGSGKKYKKCHYADDQRQAVERMNKEKARVARLNAMGHPSDSEMRGMYEEMTGKNVPTGPLPADARELLTELWQQNQLNAQAVELLEPHKAEWESYFADNPDDFNTIAAQVAANPAFDDYELTDKNIAKVRSQLGELPDDEEAVWPYATEAIRITLDSDDRTSFCDAILSRVVEHTDAGDWKTAYVVATAAERVLDRDAPINAFLRDVVVRSMRTAEKEAVTE